MSKQQISEEQNKDLLQEWQDEARKQTLETLPAFLDKLANSYAHDYGTICHAMSAAAVGAAWALDKSDSGGITGFQGGAVMWGFIRHWSYSSNECGLHILDYDNILFPQYASNFTGQSLSADTWETIQKVAARKIAEHEAAGVKYVADHAAWETELATYVEKHPDYYDRPAYYQRLTGGTGREWEAERIKEESGFDFAPTEPYKPGLHPNVEAHWRSLAAGQIPFRMKLSAD